MANITYLLVFVRMVVEWIKIVTYFFLFFFSPPTLYIRNKMTYKFNECNSIDNYTG